MRPVRWRMPRAYLGDSRQPSWCVGLRGIRRDVRIRVQRATPTQIAAIRRWLRRGQRQALCIECNNRPSGTGDRRYRG